MDTLISKVLDIFDYIDLKKLSITKNLDSQTHRFEILNFLIESLSQSMSKIQ